MTLAELFHHTSRPEISMRDLAGFLLFNDRKIMNQLEQIQAKVAELTQALADSGAKVDVLIVQNDALIMLTDSVATKLAALGESGQIPPAALSDLLGSIDTAMTTALAIGSKAEGETAKVQATIAADTPVASPAPAPADPPVEAPAPLDPVPTDPSVENPPETP